MNSLDATKTEFMKNTYNYYYYEVMPFGLKNAGATYQRLMDMVFTSEIGRNLEVYVDDMVIKTPKNQKHETKYEFLTNVKDHSRIQIQNRKGKHTTFLKKHYKMHPQNNIILYSCPYQRIWG